MNKKIALIASGTLFLLIAILHLVRYFLQIEISISGYTIPLQASIWGFIIALLLSIWMFVVSRS